MARFAMELQYTLKDSVFCRVFLIRLSSEKELTAICMHTKGWLPPRVWVGCVKKLIKPKIQTSAVHCNKCSTLPLSHVTRIFTSLSNHHDGKQLP